MRLYYTGASSFLSPQTNPRQSIGGYASSTPIAFDGNGSVFGGISSDDSASRVVRGLILRNDTSDTATQVKLWYDSKSTNSVANIRSAVVIPMPDSVGDIALERLVNESDLPYNAVFVDNRGESNSIDIPDIPSGAYVGVWVERSINRFQVREDADCDNLYNVFKTEDVNQVVTIDSSSDISKSNAYFTLGDRFYIWINDTDGTSTDPEIEGLEGIRVDVNNSDNNREDIVNKIALKVNELLRRRGEYEASSSTITSLNSGAQIPPTFVGFPNVSVTTQGASKDAETEEVIELVIDFQ